MVFRRERTDEASVLAQTHLNPKKQYMAMRVITLFLFTLLATSVAAVDYTVYSPEANFTTAAGNLVTVSFNIGDSADFVEKAAILSAKQRIVEAAETPTTQQTTDVTNARNATVEALADAKEDDAVIIRSQGSSLILRYKECKTLATDVICFKSIVYLEEDTQPLGDSALNQVKIEKGEVLFPLVISVNAITQLLEAKRTLTKTTLYPGETAAVTTTLRNTGTSSLSGARITETTILETDGSLTIFKGGLEPQASLILQYEIIANTPGNYTISGTITPTITNLTDTIVVVKSPLSINTTTTTGMRTAQLPFTLTLTNTFTGTINVTDVIITTKDQFEQSVASGVRTTAQRITIDDFKLAPGASKNITGVVTAALAGQNDLVITGRVKAVREDEFKELARYTVYAPEIILEPVVNGRVVTLRVLNADNKLLENIVIDWGDSITDSITILNSGADKPLTHTYATSAPTRVTIKARYQNAAKPVEKTVSVSLGGSGAAPAPSAPVPSPSTPTPIPPAPVPTETPPAVAPDQPPPTAPAPSDAVPEPAPSEKPLKDERTVITKILDWLESIFG